MSEAAAQAAPPSHDEIATVLSPSQVAIFTECSAKWAFKYLYRYPDPKNANLALGIATHEAIGLYMQARMSDIELEPAEVAEEFSAAWDRQLEGDTTLRETDDPEDLRSLGRALVSRYVAEVGPTVHPVAVEEKVEGEINGVRVQGRVDIREKDGTIRDIKTASRKPSGPTAQHAFQVATYVQISPAQGVPSAVVDTLVKTRTPSLHQHRYAIDMSAMRATWVLYPLCQESMRSGLYIPNRGSNLCSRNSCSFWRACQAEFGGVVS